MVPRNPARPRYETRGVQGRARLTSRATPRGGAWHSVCASVLTMPALVAPARARRSYRWTALGLGLAMVLAACTSPAAGTQPGSTVVATPRAAQTPQSTANSASSGAAATAEPTAIAPGGATPTIAPGGPSPTPDPRQRAFGLHAPLPLAGEYAVTANLDDHSLSVVPIGAAAVAATVPLDLAPRSVGTVPNSDTAVAADDSPSAHSLAIASLNTSAESATVDAGSSPDIVAGPPPNGPGSPLLVVSDTDDTIRPLDPTAHTLGTPVSLGAGPHAVHVSAAAGSASPPQIYVANAGDGSVTVLDQGATTVQSSLHVGGRPVGVTRTIDGRLWVADADAGAVVMFNATSGQRLQTIAVGPGLTALAATPDGHYLVLASSDPEAALYAVDLVNSTIGGASAAVRHLGVPGGVLALATGAEITRAYATTRDGNLVYWDLQSNSIAQSIPVGHNPVGLALGLVEPAGSAAAVVPGGGGGGGPATGSATINRLDAMQDSR